MARAGGWTRILADVEEILVAAEKGDIQTASKLLGRAEHEQEVLQKELHEKGHSVLEGNCKELKAQIFYHQKNFTGATELLEEALKLSGNKYPDALFALKWLGLIELQKSKGKSEKLHLVKDSYF